MAETKARFLANLIGADNTANDFTLPNTAVSGTDNKVLTSGGDGTVTWETTELSPTTTSISPTEVASDAGGNITFTLTGENYATSGMTVHFIATSGSDITSGMTVTHTSATSLSVEIARNAFVDANEPYSIKVTKASGLTHTLADALRVDNAPSWSTYVGTLSGSPPVVASIMDNISSATHATLSATDAEGDTVTYSETTNTLTNAGMTLSSAGAITGTPTAVSSDTNYDFTARATSTGDGGATTKTTDQNFRFTITNYVPPNVFAGKAYAGDATTNRSITFDESTNMRPDLVWIKHRDRTEWHDLYDSIRGGAKPLHVNENNSEAARANGLQTFDADGFTVNQDSAVNGNGEGIMAWAWEAGGAISGTFPSSVSSEANGTFDSNSSGASLVTGNITTTSIKQTVNQSAGFSITQYTSTGAATSNLPHNLGGTPDFIIVKCKTANGQWVVWHKDIGNGAGNYLQLNEPDVEGYWEGSANSSLNPWPTAPTSTVLTLGNTGAVTGANTFMCYAWKAVAGHSHFGAYTGQITSAPSASPTNGVYDPGYCGFKPRFVMIKCTSTGHSWQIYDGFRDTDDSAQRYLKANSNDSEISDTSREVHFTTNGFTTDSYVSIGNSGDDYIFVAFA